MDLDSFVQKLWNMAYPDNPQGFTYYYYIIKKIII